MGLTFGGGGGVNGKLPFADTADGITNAKISANATHRIPIFLTFPPYYSILLLLLYFKP
jgi:hypothetical protein